MALPLRRGAALIPPPRKITGDGADKHTRGEDGTGGKEEEEETTTRRE